MIFSPVSSPVQSPVSSPVQGSVTSGGGSSFSFAATNNGSRYPTDSPYSATPNCALPGTPVAGDILLFCVAVTDRSPVTYTGSGYTMLEEDKVAPIAAERTDAMCIGYRYCDGTESGTQQVTMSDGAHDWLAMCVLVHGPGPLVIKQHGSANARLGALLPAATAAMTGPSITTTGTPTVVWFGSVASTGAAYPGSFPSNITTATLPATFTEVNRVIDDVDEIILCGKAQVGAATTAYSGSAVVPFADTYFGFGASIVVDLFSSLTGSTWNTSDKNSNAVLSLSNTRLKVGGATGTTAARSTTSVSGKRYVEGTVCMIGGADLSTSFGVSRSSVVMNTGFDTGASTNTAGLFPAAAGARIYMDNVRLLTGDTNLSGNIKQTIIVGIAIDSATGNCWMRDAQVPGTWYGGGDPAAGTSPSFTLSGTGPILIAGSDDQGAIVASKFVSFTGDPSTYVAAAPSGFTAGL